MDKDIRIVWIVKYWQTKGVYSAEAEFFGGDMIRVGMNYFHSGDYSEHQDIAKIMAENLRRKKVASLEKQLIKIKLIQL